MFAIRGDAQTRLKDQFRRHQAERVYRAVVYGVPSPAQGTWRDHLVWDQKSLIQKETHASDPRASPAECHYRVVERFESASLIEVSLVTGGAIRSACKRACAGTCLSGSSGDQYGPEELRAIEFPASGAACRTLGFVHPTTGRPMRFTAPLPADMDVLVRSLRADSRNG